MPSTSPPIGRPARIVSLSFNGKTLDEVCRTVDEEAAKGCDLIVLPEIWSGDGVEALDGPSIRAMSALAAKHSTYLSCPIYRLDAERRFNTAVLIDRKGAIAGMYDKAYPYWDEFNLKPACEVGRTVPVFETDFGKVGLATCFDANFPPVWEALAQQGAELVVWSSAYSAGISLQAHAINYQYYILSSTLTRDCLVYDITGVLLLDKSSPDMNVARITLDLDRCIFHQNFNWEKKDKLLKEHADDIFIEKWMEREQWYVIRARRPGVSARELTRQYGMEDLRSYKLRSLREIDQMRGSRELVANR